MRYWLMIGAFLAAHPPAPPGRVAIFVSPQEHSAPGGWDVAADERGGDVLGLSHVTCEDALARKERSLEAGGTARAEIEVALAWKDIARRPAAGIALLDAGVARGSLGADDQAAVKAA